MGIRAAVLGVGRIGVMHARTLQRHPDAELIAITDTDQVRAETIAGKLGTLAASDVDHILAMQPDAVVVATPTASHPAIVRRCIAAGIPAFCEKPLSLDLGTSLELVDQIERSGVAVQIGFQRRFDAGYLRARDAVRSGDIGRIHSIRMVGCDAMPPPADYVAASGGIFRDLHIHDYDALRWVTSREVLDVYALGVNRESRIFIQHADYEAAAAVLRLTDDTLVTLIGGRFNPAGYDVRMELAGSRRTVAIGLDARSPVCAVGTDGLTRPRLASYSGFLDRFGSAYEAELGAFLDLARGRIANPCPARESLEALYIAEAALRSAQNGRAVTLKEIRSGTA